MPMTPYHSALQVFLLATAVLGPSSVACAAYAQPFAQPVAYSTPVGASACGGQPFTTSRRVAGVMTAIPGSNVTLSLPIGWTGQQTTNADGTPLYLVSAPAAGPNGGVVLGASSAEGGKPLPDLLMEVGNLLAGSETGTITGWRFFTHGRNCGGQAIFRTPTVEGYVTLIRDGELVYMLSAKYPLASAGAMRAGLDTMVATAAIAPPPAAGMEVATTAPTDASYLGCWEQAPDAHTSRSVKLRADGTYNWTRASVGFEYSLPPSEEVGRYRVTEGSLVTVSNRGKTTSRAISLSGGALTLGGDRYFRCS